MCVCVCVCVCVIARTLSPSQLLFRRYGWTKAIFHHPKYRRLHKKFDMDFLSSQGSSVRPQKKVHPMALVSAQQEAQQEDAGEGV